MSDSDIPGVCTRPETITLRVFIIGSPRGRALDLSVVDRQHERL